MDTSKDDRTCQKARISQERSTLEQGEGGGGVMAAAGGGVGRGAVLDASAKVSIVIAA